MVTIYGIKNCTTMQKAFAWCEAQGVAYVFLDYKKQGVPLDRLQQWGQTAGWQALVNTRGTTWRKLTAAQQLISGPDDAVALMRAYPSLIRRPVVETGTQLLIGFDPALFEKHLKPAAPDGQ